jgi:hypothetical protein
MRWILPVITMQESQNPYGLCVPSRYSRDGLATLLVVSFAAPESMVEGTHAW